jgi:hypothetical protein
MVNTESMRLGRTTASQPWDSADDPALAYASVQLAWYDAARTRSRRAHQFSEVLILLTTASTVVVSALHAPAALTASMAAVTLFLTGFRQVFKPNELRVDYTVTGIKLEQAIARYRLLPAADRDAAAGQALLNEVIAITSLETRAWAERTKGDRTARTSVLKTGT